MRQSSSSGLEYTGKKQPKLGERHPADDGPVIFPYLPDKHLIEAVNLAIVLERPLLIKGEPGCGKTQLARHVAYELGLAYQFWPVKSTSQARDGLYTYDTVGRLRDAQLAVHNKTLQTKIEQDYINYGPLGKAFLADEPTVVLIDEIDKADIDFPNDLLLELDEKRFVIEEIQEDGRKKEIRAKHDPIIFITSNDEKDLPDAFLRRCIFYYIKFPEPDRLVEIVQARSPKPAAWVEAVVERFWELRQEMEADKFGVRKKVSTSELLDWVKILSHYPEDEVLAQLADQLLHPGVLLKSWDDYRRYAKQPGSDTPS